MVWGLVSWVFDHPELGWVLVMAYLYIEIRTRWGRFRMVEENIVHTITVIRALVRTDPEIDTEKVDAYLVENGVEPEDFILDVNTDGGFTCDRCEDEHLKDDSPDK